MNSPILTLPILVPLCAGLLALICPKKLRGVKEAIVLVVTAYNLVLALLLFKLKLNFSLPWAGFGIEFLLKTYSLSSFFILCLAFFGFLIALYSVVFMSGRKSLNQFYAYFLFTLALANGAFLANNLILLLFFWEGLLLTIFGLINIGQPHAFKSATKAFIIVGISDLFLMVGAGLAGHLAHTLTIADIRLPLDVLGGWAFMFLVIGAIGKAGSMPFHSWIPDAANDAPLPFMVLFPAALEKLLGIYFLTRICMDLFILDAHAWVNTVLMIVGSLTIVFAVMMALIQKDYKRLLSYHAISQVGYMVLGIGTALPVGIIGGLFHMLNNAIYKSALFMTGGAVEKQTGTTDLSRIGGLRKKMPITFACFFITACSISGVPPFNGFFSKELIYDAALERGAIFYLAALVGSFFTAASFLKLGHAAYFGRPNQEKKDVREAGWPMLLPMVVLTLGCVVLGVRQDLAVSHFLPQALGMTMPEGHAGVASPNMLLVVASVIILVGALLNHWIGVKLTGSGLKAVDHIHHAPVLSEVFTRAEKKYFDPYEIGLKIAGGVSRIAWFVDRKIDWVYDNGVAGLTAGLAKGVRRMHTGNYSLYVLWSIVGMAVVLFVFIK